MISWQCECWALSQVIVTISLFGQLFAVATLPALTCSSTALMHLTHFLAKTSAGFGVLGFLDNGAMMLVSRFDI